jgi:ubiquinone/menaquinone biosynthesis C-methylase UbiE
MANPDDAKAKATTTYNAAADYYDDPSNSFWERFGRATVERLRLPLGAHVLDVCCGSGTSALPAAEMVGPAGSVLGIDLAANLLELARTKAAKRGLMNTQFRVGDLLDLRLSDTQFDAVICVFGIFFIPDMPAAVRALWHAIRPGGKLAVTTWGPRFLEPATTAFWNAVREVRPDLYKGFNPWDRISDPESLRALLCEGGIERADVVADANAHPIPSPSAWWSAVLGSGFRGTVDQLDDGALKHVYQANVSFIKASAISSVEANVIYAIAQK